MQRQCNVLAALACPVCRDELLLTLDQVHEESAIRCPSCGTTVPLRDGAEVPPPAYIPVLLTDPAGPLAL